MKSLCRRFPDLLVVLAIWLTPLPARADSTVVFNEIMYHPPGDEATLEWVELFNQMAVDMDLSGWSLDGGVRYVFPEGTIVAGKSYVVVSSQPGALAAATGFLGALGPFLGRLENSGEQLEIRDRSGRLMDSVRYRDSGRWPVAPDGSGLSLAKRRAHAASDPAENWAPSAQLQGTPGVVNFTDETGGGDGPTLPSELVSYWNFDETSGSTSLDSAGSNDGSLGNNTDRVAGFIGPGALSFDDSPDGFVNVGPGDGSFSASAGVTIEALIRPDAGASPDNHDMIFRKEDGPSRIVLGFQNDGNDDGLSQPDLGGYGGPVLAFGLNVGGEYRELDMPLDGLEGRPDIGALRGGEFHHVAATYDRGSGLKAIYIDGGLAFSTTLGAGSSVSSGGSTSAYIGNMAGRGQGFSGLIDEVAFWKRGLAAAEISAHHERVRRGESYFSSTGVPVSANAPVAFNEVFPGQGASGWLEIVNFGASTLDLEGLSLKTGNLAAEFVFAGGSLVPGEVIALTAPQLGFAISPGERVFLFAADGNAVIDAIAVGAELRARRPDGTGAWLVPDRDSPGARNSFSIRDDIVINEIMYHPRSEAAVEDVIEEEQVLAIDASWRYTAPAGGLSAGWADVDFDDGDWDEGPALIYQESSPLPGPKNTEIELGPVAFYFRARFDYTGDPAAATLRMRHVIDDGAVFYLNGGEVLRFNMPSGAIAPDTLASPGVSNASFTGPVAIPPDRLVQGTNVLAVEVHQSSTGSSDVVLGAEVFAGVVVVPGHPFREPPESWIELHNRGPARVDLTGWRLDRGVDYPFEDGVSIGAGEYLVVAEDAQYLSARYPLIPIVGDLEGNLSNRSDTIVLEDERGNPVDEVTYFDDGRWPAFADGSGASLELRDPQADNDRGEAWAASDEGARTSWRDYSYQMVATANVGPTSWREFVLGLLDAGEILLDDISVLEDPDGSAREFLQNGDFEGGANAWRILGNHRHSRVIDDPDRPGNRVLHLIATGATEHMHNHLETTLDGVQVTNGRLYRVSFRARWLAGSNQLNTRLYFNRAPRTTLIDRPASSGSPGQPNTVLESNIGPTFDGFSHFPMTPSAGEPVTVTVRAGDPDGVSSCTLRWRLDGAAWNAETMSGIGDGSYSAVIPGQSSSRIVQFYVEAADSRGAISYFPARGPESRALYKVEDGQGRNGPLDNFRIIMTLEDTNFLHSETQVMSNERLGGTVVYRDREAFYDVGVRLKGSERGRVGGARVSFSVRFHPDHLFRGLHRSVSLDRSGGWGIGAGPHGQDEIIFKHVVNAAGRLPSLYDDIAWLVAPRSAQNGPTLVQMAKYGSHFLDSMYENGSDGVAYKVELIYYPTSTTDGNPESLKRPQPDGVIGTDLRDLGDDKEAYRWTFLLENHRDRDDYDRLIEFCKTMPLSGSALLARVEDILDVDEVLRMYAVHSLCGANDTYFLGSNAHNLIWYARPTDQRFVAFAWDQDFAWSRSTSNPLWGGENVAKLFSFPQYQRRFYGHLKDIMDTTYNTTYLRHWTEHYGALAEESASFGRVLSYVGTRRAFVQARLPTPVPFEITTNGGADFTTDEAQVLLEGRGGIDVDTVRIVGRANALDLQWTSSNQWQAVVPLRAGTNELDLVALGFRFDVVGDDRMTIVSTTEPVFLRGDVNLDGGVDIGDAVTLLFHVFRGQPIGCADGADVDDNSVLETTDAIRLLEYLFRNGAPPAVPFPLCGPDATEDALECETVCP